MKAGTDIFPGPRTIIYNGLLLTIAAVFVYSNLVLLYVIFRSSVTIWNSMPPGQRGVILFANGVSAGYAVAVISLLVIIASAGGALILSFIMKWIFMHLVTTTNTRKAVAVGAISGLCWSGIMYAILQLLLGKMMIAAYPETLFFWFLWPALACTVVSVAGAVKLNRYPQKKDPEKLVAPGSGREH